jgi:hypothetical protein
LRRLAVRLPAFILAPLILVLSAGCVHTPRKEDFHPKPKDTASASVLELQRVYEGESPVGYLETQAVTYARQFNEKLQYNVYDEKFNRLGFILEKGEAYIYNKKGSDADFVGQFVIEEGVRRVLGLSQRVYIKAEKIFVPIEK